MKQVVMFVVIGLFNFSWLGMTGLTLNLVIGFIGFVIIAVNAVNRNKKGK